MRQFNFAAFGVRLAGVEACSEYFEPILADRSEEILLAALVNEDGCVIRLLSFPGGNDSVRVEVRMIISEALKRDAAGLVIAHNHPSGDERPSQDDRDFTTKLARACAACGLTLLDHLILGRCRIYSFRRAGLV